MYEHIEEIPDRLRAKNTVRAAVPAPATTRPPVRFPTPKGGPIESGNGGGQQGHPKLPEEDTLGPGGGKPPRGNGVQEGATMSRREAALTFAAAYCRIMARRREDLKGVDATRARLWSLLHDRASSMDWPRLKRYKLLMQGPLVHVLVCLDGIKVFATKANKDSKEQLQGNDHRRLEELIERSDRSR